MVKGYRRYQDPDDLGRGSLQDPEFSMAERKQLFHIDQKIAGCTTLDGVMEFLAEELHKLFHQKNIYLFINDEERRAAILQWRTGAPAADGLLRPGYKVDLPDGILDRPMESDEPLIVGNVGNAPLGMGEVPWFAELIDTGMRSCVIAPLMFSERNIGLVVVTGANNYQFGYHEKLLFNALRERVSQSIHIGYMVDQLTAANSSYLEMLGFVSHELKNPLAAMVMDGKLLMQGYVGELTEKQETRISKMVGKAQYLLSLIREYLDLSRLESGELHARPRNQIDLQKNILAPSLEMVSSQIEERGMKFSQELPPQPTMVQCDPDLLVIVMVNLLGNAAKYGLDGGELKLKVKLNNEGLQVTVFNEGPGFPESAKNRLFRKFSRVRTEELLKRKGTGVGLYTVWQIIRLHGGTVWAESKEGSWAEFGFRIPQPLKGLS